MAIFINHTMKIDFELMIPEEKEKKMNQIFQKDIALRHKILGLVLGIFTITEYAEFTKESAAHTKRILSLAKQRILSNL
jgi:hypothetical protein